MIIFQFVYFATNSFSISFVAECSKFNTWPRTTYPNPAPQASTPDTGQQRNHQCCWFLDYKDNARHQILFTKFNLDWLSVLAEFRRPASLLNKGSLAVACTALPRRQWLPKWQHGKDLADKYFSRTFGILNSVKSYQFKDLIAKRMVVWTETCPKA